MTGYDVRERIEAAMAAAEDDAALKKRRHYKPEDQRLVQAMVGLLPAERDAIYTLAEERGVSYSGLMRTIIQDWLGRNRRSLKGER